jgi:hypothetical protein
MTCNVSERCDTCEEALHEYHINDLYTIKCSGMLGHRNRACLDSIQEPTTPYYDPVV